MRSPAAILTFFALGTWGLDRVTEADEAAIKDPQVECSPYSYPPLAAQASAFPIAWQPAKMLPNDSEADARWKSIVSNVPNTSPKPASGSSSSSHYGPQDPDCWWTATKCTTPKLSGLPLDIAEVPEPSTMGYGFDDGPNCSHNAFYDYLAAKNQKATMFFIGSNVMNWPLEAQRALSDGHEICVHTWSHRAMTSLASPDAFAELYYNETHKACCRGNPNLLPPYGDVDDRIRAIANGLGLRTILWKHDSNDWMYGSGGTGKKQIDANYDAFINQATTGSFTSTGAIILTHEINNFTMQESIDYYDRLKNVFKYIVPVAVALNKTQPYVETNYTMPTFEQYISGTTTTTSGNNPSDPPRVGGSATQTQPSHPTNTNTAATILPWTNVFGVLVAITVGILL